jgi:predicted O-methyltransferase YrrM
MKAHLCPLGSPLICSPVLPPGGDVGVAVMSGNRERFTQLLGDSHELDGAQILDRFGRFDLVFIDGDHSREGIRQDTALADAMLADGGTICWHDANPKAKHLPAREFLESELARMAIATADTYVGGVACWNHSLDL